MAGETKDLICFLFFSFFAVAFFVVWSALSVTGSMVVAWRRKSYLGPGEIAFLVNCFG